jgi:hypothetical protein
MDHNIYIDIETIPAQRPDIIAEIRASKVAELEAAISELKAPSNYGAEAAAKFVANKSADLRDSLESEIDAAYRKTGLDGSYGQICVIGWALNDGQVRTQYSLENEAELLGGFYDDLSEIRRSEYFNTCVIGHNVSAFDLRFMTQRSIVNGVRPHPVIVRAAQAKPWESEKVFDTMVQWSGIGNRISLDRLCKALGIATPKADITGATVWDAIKAGRIEDVAAYCAGDVEATRQVFKLMTYQAEPVLFAQAPMQQEPIDLGQVRATSELPESVF